MGGRDTYVSQRIKRAGDRPSLTVVGEPDRPGAYVPFHKHPELEQSFVLEGSGEDHDGVATAGDYIWRKPGSLHDNRSPGGAVLLAIYRKPNIYFSPGGDTSGF